jgi:hypothetical protein
VLPSNPTAAKLGQEADTERAAVRKYDPFGIAEHVAPTDDLAATQYDELRIPLLDIGEDEFGCVLKRRRLQKREVLLFPRDDIDCHTEAGDVVFRNRDDFKIEHFRYRS